MMHEILDYSLSAAIIGWLLKNGYTFLTVWRGGNSLPNGAATKAQMDLILEHVRHEEELLREVRDAQSDTNKSLTELVTIARMKWS